MSFEEWIQNTYGGKVDYLSVFTAKDMQAAWQASRQQAIRECVQYIKDQGTIECGHYSDESCYYITDEDIDTISKL